MRKLLHQHFMKLQPPSPPLETMYSLVSYAGAYTSAYLKENSQTTHIPNLAIKFSHLLSY